jgi:hypothetical protein
VLDTDIGSLLLARELGDRTDITLLQSERNGFVSAPKWIPRGRMLPEVPEPTPLMSHDILSRYLAVYLANCGGHVVTYATDADAPANDCSIEVD